MRPESVWNDVLGTRAVTSIVRQDCKGALLEFHSARRYQEEYTTEVVNILKGNQPNRARRRTTEAVPRITTSPSTRTLSGEA